MSDREDQRKKLQDQLAALEDDDDTEVEVGADYFRGPVRLARKYGWLKEPESKDDDKDEKPKGEVKRFQSGRRV